MVLGNPNFDVYRLPDEHQMLREAVRSLADDKIAPRAAEIDETGEFPYDVLDALVRAGFHAVHIPEEYGGAGADAIATAIVIEEVARACASSALIPAVNKLGTMPLLLSASEELKKQVLPAVAAGEALISYALSEREAGSDAAAMRTRAVLRGDDWVLNGTKSWITNAGVSTYYTVMAVTEPGVGTRGISAFVVHKDDPGFSVGPKERKLGIRGSPTCEIYFEDCAIPFDRIIGEPGTGFKTALRTLDHTRLTIGAQALGIAQGAVDAASAYVTQRKQFGQPIGEFQLIQEKLAKMEVARLNIENLVFRVLESSAAGQSMTLSEASAMKLYAAGAATEVALEAVQLFGGNGYMAEYEVEQLARDAKVLQIYAGTDEIQVGQIARALLA